MPVRAESYVWTKGLHPAFQMNLPEGFRKDFLRERFGPVATVDDFSLLALTGASTLGRVAAYPAEGKRAPRQTHDSIAGVLSHKDSRQALLQYLSDTALDGISGVMPKALAADEKLALKTPGWILKTGREDTPGLCINEFICLELARHIGLSVPDARLSQDGEVLAVSRFDIAESGESLGLEDMCSLLGMSPAQKYEATAEQIIHAMTAFLSDAEKLDSSRRFVDLLLLNAAIRNADAHAKNYALIYSNREDVALAPAYDIISVHAYRSYSKNPYAILVGGTKTWYLRKPIEKLASERLNLDSSHVRKTLERIREGMNAQAKEIDRMAITFPGFREPAKNMLRTWREGFSALTESSGVSKVDFSAAKLSEEKKLRKKRIARKVMNPERLD